MATRPVFVPCQRSGCFIEEVQITFHWHAGVAPIQKKRNVTELHAAASVKGLSQILEVSTKSDDKLGQRLSSFNLRVSRSDGSTIPLESAYQGSKVFTDGGPFNDLFVRDPREAKRDGRLKSSGRLIGFKFDKSEWELEPRTAFYDWLYLYALKDHSEYLRRLYKYDAFSDIEFNPNSSINTQARSCALLVSLLRQHLFPRAVYDRSLFIGLLRQGSVGQRHADGSEQSTLL